MKKYAICINNGGYPASLELRKIYEVIPDEKAESRSQIRIVDESGESYLYPERMFHRIEVDKKTDDILENIMHG